MNIILDDLSGPEVHRLLDEHLQSMAAYSPPESMHALGLDGLRHPQVTFWTIWQNSDLLGCGALRELGPEFGEIKSMRTASTWLRKGVATRMLTYIVEEARRRGYRRLSLETGAQAEFAPARRLYASFGFTECDPFGDYVEDRNSVFMTLALPPWEG